MEPSHWEMLRPSVAVLALSLSRWSLETCHLAAVLATFQTLSKRRRTTDVEGKGGRTSILSLDKLLLWPME